MARQSTPEASLRFIVEIPSEIAVDLNAFCEHHFDASRAGVIRRAIKFLIEHEAQSDAIFRKKLDEARRIHHVAKIVRLGRPS